VSVLDNLGPLAEALQGALAAKDAAREKALPLAREAIRHSSTAIPAVHRQEFETAAGLVRSANECLRQAEAALAAHAVLATSGIIMDAQKELTEANVTLAVVTGRELPSPQGLGVEAAAYLNGLGEAAGELRRYLLDRMRQGDLSRGEELLGAMDDIYSVLVTMDFPDAITGGLRRTTDMVRGVLERTRSDLTLAMRQQDLGKRLEKLEKDI
jgi:translin